MRSAPPPFPAVAVLLVKEVSEITAEPSISAPPPMLAEEEIDYKLSTKSKRETNKAEGTGVGIKGRSGDGDSRVCLGVEATAVEARGRVAGEGRRDDRDTVLGVDTTTLQELFECQENDSETREGARTLAPLATLLTKVDEVRTMALGLIKPPPALVATFPSKVSSVILMMQLPMTPPPSIWAVFWVYTELASVNLAIDEQKKAPPLPVRALLVL